MTYAIVSAPCGCVRGKSKKTYREWRGIPYAAPPIGERRFLHAQPLLRWEGTYDALEPASFCPQPGMVGGSVSEDCLFLNIWAPLAGEKKAVVLYVHGGSYMSGYGSDIVFAGDKLAAENDVVVVNFNYRIGALGFLDFSFLGEGFKTNCGLSDMIAAIEWVHKNIVAFGGDPDNITLVGQSAGATSVATLATMDLAKKYISKIVMMSGGPIWLHTQEEAQSIAKEYLQFIGIKSGKELREIDAKQLAAKNRKFMNSAPSGESSFAITIDNTLVKSFPIPAAKSGATKGIPMLIGATRDELSFVSNKLLAGFMALADLDLVTQCEECGMRENIKSAYRRYGFRAKAVYVTDFIFRLASLWYAQSASEHSNVWMYRFNYRALALRVILLNACHFSDIPFWFGNFWRGRTALMFMLTPLRFLTNKLSQEMRRDFTGFVKTGKLDWQQIKEQGTQAKHYNSKIKTAPMINSKILQVLENSRFKANCLNGVSVTQRVRGTDKGKQ